MNNTAIEKSENMINVPAQAQPATWYTPLVDVIETADEFTFQADIPGVNVGDLDVSFENGTLTIQGKVQPRQAAGQNYVWREYGVGHFYRQFSLNTPVDTDAIRAELKNGVLNLHVPKAETAKAKKIAIKSA